jgi:CDP-glucose 4,6-dehydratase
LLARKAAFAEAWNFGPDAQSNRTVEEVLQGLSAHWPALSWQCPAVAQPHEAKLLYLDCAKAHGALGWRPSLSLRQTLEMTAKWYQAYYDAQQVASVAQLEQYVGIARKAGAVWATN